MCFYYPVTLYQLLRIKYVTVVESAIFIMSLDLDAVVTAYSTRIPHYKDFWRIFIYLAFCVKNS